MVIMMGTCQGATWQSQTVGLSHLAAHWAAATCVSSRLSLLFQGTNDVFFFATVFHFFVGHERAPVSKVYSLGVHFLGLLRVEFSSI